VNKVVEISAIHPYRLKVRFSDGASGVHDYSALVNETGPMIEPLRDPDLFRARLPGLRRANVAEQF
jgi:hypothetical protein